MGKAHVEVSQVINARAEDVYAVLADYHTGHPAILPRQYFKELTVEEGGIGAGTVFRLRMSVLGTERESRMTVSEPEPGRVMVETAPEAGIVTTFTVEPLADGTQTRISIATDITTRPGLSGMIEAWMSPPLLRRIYRQELEQLAEYMRGQGAVS